MALNTSSDGLKTVSLEWLIQWSALSLCFLGPRSLRPHGDPLSSHSRPNSEDWAPRCQDGCHRHAAETTTWRIGQENLINWINQRLSLLLVITLSSIAESVCLGVWCTVLFSLQLEKCAQDLGSTSKSVGSSMAQLLTCAAQGNEHYTGTVLLPWDSHSNDSNTAR